MSEHTINIRPTILAGTASVLVLAVVLKAVQFASLMANADVATFPFLQVPLTWPFLVRFRLSYFGVFVLQIVLLGLLTALISWLGIRGVSPRRSSWGVVIIVWFASILSGYTVGPVAVPLIYPGMGYQNQYVLSAAGAGGGWGLWVGWIAGLLAAFVFSAGQRRSTPGRQAPTSYPGS